MSPLTMTVVGMAVATALVGGCAGTEPTIREGNHSADTTAARTPVRSASSAHDPLRDVGTYWGADLLFDFYGEEASIESDGRLSGSYALVRASESNPGWLDHRAFDTMLGEWRSGRKLAVINLPVESWPQWCGIGRTSNDWIERTDVDRVYRILLATGFERVVIQEVVIQHIVRGGMIIYLTTVRDASEMLRTVGRGEVSDWYTVVRTIRDSTDESRLPGTDAVALDALPSR